MDLTPSRGHLTRDYVGNVSVVSKAPVLKDSRNLYWSYVEGMLELKLPMAGNMARIQAQSKSVRTFMSFCEQLDYSSFFLMGSINLSGFE